MICYNRRNSNWTRWSQGLGQEGLCPWTTKEEMRSFKPCSKIQIFELPLFTVAARALSIYWMFTIKWNTLKIKLILFTTLKTKGALIDSRATENFFNPRTLVKLRLPTKKLKNLRNILNINSISNQAEQITRICQLKVKLNKTVQEMDFFITDLEQDQIILSYPFLQIFNPIINWSNRGINYLSQIMITLVKLWKHCKRAWK